MIILFVNINEWFLVLEHGGLYILQSVTALFCSSNVIKKTKKQLCSEFLSVFYQEKSKFSRGSGIHRVNIGNYLPSLFAEYEVDQIELILTGNLQYLIIAVATCFLICFFSQCATMRLIAVQNDTMDSCLMDCHEISFRYHRPLKD